MRVYMLHVYNFSVCYLFFSNNLLQLFSKNSFLFSVCLPLCPENSVNLGFLFVLLLFFVVWTLLRNVSCSLLPQI